jgi:hypothetical protein
MNGFSMAARRQVASFPFGQLCISWTARTMERLAVLDVGTRQPFRKTALHVAGFPSTVIRNKHAPGFESQVGVAVLPCAEIPSHTMVWVPLLRAELPSPMSWMAARSSAVIRGVSADGMNAGQEPRCAGGNKQTWTSSGNIGF